MMALMMRSVYRGCSKRASLCSALLLNRLLLGNVSHPPSFSPMNHPTFSVQNMLLATALWNNHFDSANFERKESRDRRSPFETSMGRTRSFSQDVAHYPEIADPKIMNVFKDFIAAGWGELPDVLIHDALKVLAKDTDDKAGKETLKNVFRAAEAVEEFIGSLESLRMAIDDHAGLSGENSEPYPEHYGQALRTAYDRYTKYLDSFGPEEFYLKKKVETEVGTRMIHLKMRCSHLGSEWGKITVLGTSGISGSYVEQRAK